MPVDKSPPDFLCSRPAAGRSIIPQETAGCQEQKSEKYEKKTFPEMLDSYVKV